MMPPEVVTLLNDGLVAVVSVAGAVVSVVMAIASFKFMRRAVGGGDGSIYVDSKGNEYLSEKDADEADRRSKPDAPDFSAYDDDEDGFEAYNNARMKNSEQLPTRFMTMAEAREEEKNPSRPSSSY